MNSNIFSRLFNNIVSAIEDQIRFLKLIVMVTDSDIIKNVDTKKSDAESLFETLMRDFIAKLHKLMIDHKAILPQKALKYKYPTFLWILPPGHCNFNDNQRRQWYASAIEKNVMAFNEMRFMRLKSWDFNDTNLVMETPTGYRFTSQGLLRYWTAVNAAIQFWDKSMKKTQQNHQRNSQNVKTAYAQKKNIPTAKRKHNNRKDWY